MSKLKGEPVIILGTFRGGTSALATALARLGLHLGDESTFLAADEFNQGGYWEIAKMQELHQAIFSALGMSYMGAERLPSDWNELPGAAQMLDEMGALLNHHFAGHERWGWKEPSTTLLLPLYKEVLRRHGVSGRYAIIVRNPLSIAASQSRRQGEVSGQSMSETHRMVGLWVHYTLMNLRETIGQPRRLVLYESFVQDPQASVERVAELLPWKPNQDVLGAAVASVNPSWSHSRHDMRDLDQWPPIVGKVYELCTRIDSDASGFAAGSCDAEIHALSEEWVITSDMVHPSQLPPGRFTLSWLKKGQLDHRSVTYVPTGSWQTLSVEATPSPGEPVQVEFYPAPCHVWIRRATWNVNGKGHEARLKQGPHGLFEDRGIMFVTSFGPVPILAIAPIDPGPCQLEIEFLLRCDLTVLSATIAMLRDRMQAQPGRALA